MRFPISLCVLLLLLVNDVMNISVSTVTPQTALTELSNPSVPPPTTTTDVRTPVSEPCTQYSILDDGWRGLQVLGHNSPYNVHDDTLVEWSGWYRLYLNGTSAQLSEWCVSYSECGGGTGLYLNASHPKLEDGVVTRDVLGMSSGWSFSQCGNYRSNSIQVKACPGDYYVYELVKPSTFMPRPTYCTVAFNNISDDPCYNYESLDRPWRATNESGFFVCDGAFTWNGWYRLFCNGMNIRMPESCIGANGCNTQNSLSLNGPHPQIEDGVVIRELCGSVGFGCCAFRSTPIRVKACPGDYYVYELSDPSFPCSGYCIDVRTLSQLPTTSPAAITGSSITLNYDPCYNYNSLDNYWRTTYNNWFADEHAHDDSRVHWDGWYRLFINGSSAEIPEWCFTYMSCGGYVSLWLGDPHPQLEDGVVTRKVYGSIYNQCNYRSDPIQVKACPGNYYVYKLIRPKLTMPAPVYCAVSFNTSNTDPCYNYTNLDEPWRASNNSYFGSVCDYNVVWNGWYRLFYNAQSVQMPDSCVSNGMCGSNQPLWLNGSHPSLEDGVVTRQVCSPTWTDCCGYTSHPIQVKACPGNYYVYHLTKPTFCSSYCAEVTEISNILASTTAVTISTQESPIATSEADPFDPCYNYTVLDNYWRSVNNTQFSSIRCDMSVNWNGWYRLYISGQSAQMPDTCVNELSCSTHAPLWLNGEHPHVEDGVVTRSICGHWNNDCCYFHSNPIQVKACPGSYYVYEFVSPSFCFGTYCAEVTTSSSDPCFGYSVIDENWRDLRQDYYNYYSFYGHDDTLVDWKGWYRLYLNGKNAQLSEWCVTQSGCGGDIALFLNGSHPRLEDGVVTREVLGTWSSSSWVWWWWWYTWSFDLSKQCGYYKSSSIQVKACPGDYYVYELVRPNASMIRPAYCTVAFDSINNDPCYNYESLDRPWRATNESGFSVSDEFFSWNGWYRLFYNGMNIQMSESCIGRYVCNAFSGLSLKGPHPQIDDGVVIREVCGGEMFGCCAFRLTAIRVKACPGDYYVYEFVKPLTYSNSAYCTDISTVTEAFSSTSPALIIGSSMSTFNRDYDPCNDYNILDNHWRSTLNYRAQYYFDDSRVEWQGWYRLYINGISAQMPEWCFIYMSCGGFSSLWLGGPHPQLEDGVVIREVYGSVNDQCSSYQSNPIQVKACTGNYYVYEFKKPKISIPAPTYCADPFTTPSVDPCYNYNSLDEPWRATDHPYYDKYYYYNVMCDYNAWSWNGWYRLFYNGQSVQMPESCVSAGMCGTNYPLWLNGSHPRLEDGVVTREVCGSSWSGCCSFKSHPIQVKACPGNYYVYEFVRPQLCSAYCADISTINTTTTTTNISSGPFYPFGFGDTETNRSDDGISSVIYFRRPFIFFGQTYNQVYISNNGFLTFDWPWYSYYPYQFPGYGGQDIIAPLWADIDNRFTGVISYQQYTYGSVISNATQDINLYFPDLRFSATWVFVVTWDRVPYYPISRTETSFQVVFISDGHLSFILMNYGKVAPTHRFVQAGYDTNSSRCYFSITSSLQNETTNLTYSSNVNVPGRWAFRTDHRSRCCQFNDHCSEFNCTENEHCKKKHGVYGCSCKKNHHRSHPSAADSFDFTETCENSHGSISLSRCQLFDAGFPSDILHLNDPSCRGTVRDGQVEFYFDNNEHICGTSLTANGTHIIYENFIKGEPNTTGLLVSRAKVLKLSFSCVYLQTQTLSMDINPLESKVHKTLPAGQGTYRVRMIPYQDAEFLHPFTGNVAKEVSKRIFVEVRVDGVDDRQFASVIDTCWATPVNDPHDSLRWDLIVDRCPNPNDDTVELVENGDSMVSRFSFEMFIFTANSTKVYLHCAIHLCLLIDNHCSVNCDSEHHRRQARSADIHDSAHISLGPFMWSENDKDLPVPRQVPVA